MILLPSIKQDSRLHCGYAALASVALYHGVARERLLEEELVSRYSEKALSGFDLVRMAQDLGFKALVYEGSLEDLKKNLRAGRPVLVLLSRPLTVGNYPSTEFWWELFTRPLMTSHWVVVTGIGPESEIVYHDPAKGRLVTEEHRLDRAWEREFRICVLISRQRMSTER